MRAAEWEDSEGTARVTFKIEAARIGILPHRLQAVTLREKAQEPAPAQAALAIDDAGNGTVPGKKAARQKPK